MQKMLRPSPPPKTDGGPIWLDRQAVKDRGVNSSVLHVHRVDVVAAVHLVDLVGRGDQCPTEFSGMGGAAQLGALVVAY